MSRKDAEVDLGIRFRRVIEPISENDEIVGFATLDAIGKYEVIPLSVVSSREDLDLLGGLMSEGIRWHMPDFGKYVEEYNGRINAIAYSNGDDKMPVWERFMEESLSEIGTMIVAYLREFVYLEDPRSYEILAIFAIQSFFREQMSLLPLLLIEGVYGSGKTTLMKTLERICYRGHRTGNYSAAQLSAFVDEYNCTILLDEANDNLSSERGPGINQFLKESVDKTGISERMRPRANGTIGPSTVRVYTSVAVCTLGGYMEDTISRGISIKMPTYNTSDCEDIDLVMLTGGVFTHDPSVILGKLHALRFITLREKQNGRFGSFDTGFVDFRPGIREAHLELRHGTYGEKVYSEKREPVRNRSMKILVCYYAISKYLGNSKQVIDYILGCEKKKGINKQSSEYGTIVRALCETILNIDDDGEKPPLFLKNRLTAQSCLEACRGIKMRDITEKAWSIINNSFDETGMVQIEKNTAARILGRLEIPIREGGGRYKYLDPSKPVFLEKLMMAIRHYAPVYEPEFRDVGDYLDSLKNEGSEEVKVVTSDLGVMP